MDAMLPELQTAIVESEQALRSTRLLPQVKRQRTTLLSCMLRLDSPNKCGQRATRSSGVAGSPYTSLRR